MSVSVGVSPVDLTSQIGQIRTLLGDTDALPLNPPVAGSGEYRYWSDVELQGIINMFSFDQRPSATIRVAIWCLRQIAVSRALLLLAFTSDDLAVNGPAITAAIQKVAADMEKAADGADADDAASVFTITSTNTDSFNWFPEGTPWPFALDGIGTPASQYWHLPTFWGYPIWNN